ncbi:M48 family metallopeptidase [Lewinella sp. LCG006]|uniref:M48 family metallopeptidase n=1 Tax=Lewinella sp. LCG006 TaxID=3231911 RepID=UPI0034607C87
MRYFSLAIIGTMMSSLIAIGCGGSGGGLNFFSVEQDIELGRQVSQEINSNPSEFPILPEQSNREVYQYIRNITNRLLSTGKVAHKDDFAWEVKIIDDPETLNAFATPGGYIYVYTGLIKFLDSEDELAGVMGHEIAHAAQRHSTQQMTKIYGLQILASVVTGNSEPGMIEQIALGLASLKNSRSHESEADEYSVIYLCGTSYNANGAAGFFRKMEESSAARPPEFLSTHPNPGNRVADIDAKAKELGCRGTSDNRGEYMRIKSLLQ